MAKMEFAVFDDGALNYFRHVPRAADLYEQRIREVQLEEQLGFRYHFLVEHQGNTAGQWTSPAVFLTALARHTSTIRIGGMIFLLPFYNPLRLAEDAATLDHLSGGRLEFGAGLGTLAHEFERWNIPFEERREIATEALEIIKKAWTEDVLTYEGKYWKFDEALPMPQPYQKPHPPIWFAGRSRESLGYAVANKYRIGVAFQPDPIAAETFSLWRQLWREAEYDEPMPHSILTGSVYVAETDNQAREEAEPYLVQTFTWGSDRVGYSRHGGRLEENSTRQAHPEFVKLFQGMTTGVDFWLENGLAHVGSPETVIRRLKKQQELMGFDTFGGSFRFGPIPNELVEKSMRLFANEVMPAFS